MNAILSHADEGVGQRAPSRLSGFPASGVNRIVVKVVEHGERVLANAIRPVRLTEVRLDEFLPSKEVGGGAPGTSRPGLVKGGSGMPSTSPHRSAP